MQAVANEPVKSVPDQPATRSGAWSLLVHALAILTVLAACPLFFLGAEVTTKGVGMADQRPIVNPLQALSEFEGQSLGFRIEHSHRIAGWLVGMCGIAVALGLWLWESRRWLQWLGTVALLMIIVQGVLGIFRVQLNALLGPTLAWVHGSFAQIVFATLVSVAVCTSRSWRGTIGGLQAACVKRQTVVRFAIVMIGLVYVQLVLGGMVRHQGTLPAARAHLLGAFVTTAGLLGLVKLAWELEACRWPGRIVLGLLVVQVMLGVEAWFSWTTRFFLPQSAYGESTATHWLRSGHYLVGTWLFAATVVLMLQALRSNRPAEAHI